MREDERRAKVCESGLEVGCEKNVLRLDVAVFSTIEVSSGKYE